MLLQNTAIVQGSCFFEWHRVTRNMFKTFLFLNRAINKQSGEWCEEVLQYMANYCNAYDFKKAVS